MVRVLRYIIQAVCGLVLIYWGYKNLYTIETFEYRLVEQCIGNWYVAPVIARLVVGLKFMAGTFLVLNLNPKNILPKLALLLMALHIFDLAWGTLAENIIIYKSYTDIIRYNTTLSIIAIVYVTGVSVFMLLKPKNADIRFKWLRHIIGLALIALPFILNAIFPDNLMDVAEYNEKPFDTSLVESPVFQEMASDKVIVGFFSTSCPYCLFGAQKVAISQKRWDNFPNFFICFQGTEEDAQNFLNFARHDFDHEVLSNEAYFKLSDGRFPKFAWIENGIEKKRWDGRSFNYYTLKHFCDNQ